MASKAFTLTASSQVKKETLADFISNRVEEDLATVPGVGPVNADHLRSAGIETTHALIGKFLTLRRAGMSVRAHVDAFHDWLASIGISAHRASITRSIAELVNTWIPGTFSEAAFVE